MIRLKSLLLEIDETDSLKNQVKQLEYELEAKFPEIDILDMYIRSSGDLYINHFRIKKDNEINHRGKGIGAKIMDEIIKFADLKGLYVTLHAAAEPRYKEKLFQFYKRVGFVKNKGRNMMYKYSTPFYMTMVRRPKSNTSLKESINILCRIDESLQNIRFEDNNRKMIIPTAKGDYYVILTRFKHNGIIKYNAHIHSPPDHYQTYNVNGTLHKMAVGGTLYIVPANTNLEQTYAGISEKLKSLGLQYTQVQKLQVIDREDPKIKADSEEFNNKLKTVMTQFQKDMKKPENKLKDFGKGPPEFGQWISGDDVKSGRLKWVIDNYGDFWIVVKWSISPRQNIKASEFLKNYEHIIHGKEAAGDHCREVFIRKEPFQGI